jgi:Mn-containing catalase
MQNDPLKRIADGAVALDLGDAIVVELTARLPEARVIQRITDDHTSRVITFELLTAEEH